MWNASTRTYYFWYEKIVIYICRARRLELDVDDNEIERLLKCDDIYDLNSELYKLHLKRQLEKGRKDDGDEGI